MERRISFLLLAAALCLLLAGPAFADSTVYDNGPINGTVDAWTINSGFWVSNTFTLTGSTNLTKVQLGLWAFPGDENPLTLDWSIGTAPGLSDIFSGTGAALTSTFVSTNPFGFSLIESDFSLSGLLGAGTYWLTIQNVVVPSGDPIFWDENNGPSNAWESVVGDLTNCADHPNGGTCSESFQMYGTTTSSPEPSSVLLMGSGMLMFAGFLRRKLGR